MRDSLRFSRGRHRQLATTFVQAFVIGVLANSHVAAAPVGTCPGAPGPDRVCAAPSVLGITWINVRNGPNQIFPPPTSSVTRSGG